MFSGEWDNNDFHRSQFRRGIRSRGGDVPTPTPTPTPTPGPCSTPTPTPTPIPTPGLMALYPRPTRQFKDKIDEKLIKE